MTFTYFSSRDIFSLGFGPFRWVCTSGLPEDLRQTDAIATSVLQSIIKGIEFFLESIIYFEGKRCNRRNVEALDHEKMLQRF